MDQQLIDQVATAILNYLRERPASADTIEGIHRWWIDWHGRMEDQTVTQEALQQLEKQQLLESVSIGNRLLWRQPRHID